MNLKVSFISFSFISIVVILVLNPLNWMSIRMIVFYVVEILLLISLISRKPMNSLFSIFFLKILLNVFLSELALVEFKNVSSWVDTLYYTDRISLSFDDLLKTTNISDIGAVIWLKYIGFTREYFYLYKPILYIVLPLLLLPMIKGRVNQKVFMFLYSTPIYYMYLSLGLKEYILMLLIFFLLYRIKIKKFSIRFMITIPFRIYYFFLYIFSFIYLRLNKLKYLRLLSIILLGIPAVYLLINIDKRVLLMIEYAKYERGIEMTTWLAYTVSLLSGFLGPFSDLKLDNELLTIYEFGLRKAHSIIIFIMIFNWKLLKNMLVESRYMQLLVLLLIGDIFARALLMDTFELRKAILSMIIGVFIGLSFLCKYRGSIRRVFLAFSMEFLFSLTWSVLK